MQSVATIPEGIVKKSPKAGQAHFRTWRLIKGFHRYIETKPWEEGRLLNQGLDNLCQCLLMAAFFCFLVPVILMTVH